MKLGVNLKSRPRLVSIGIAAAAVAGGAAVVTCGFRLGMGNLQGLALVAFVFGVVTCVAGIVLFERGLRRRARAAAIAKLIPRYRSRRHGWSAAVGEVENGDAALFENSHWTDEFSGKMPVAGAKLRAATRALLVSLEDELRREATVGRRSGRPACRRARLRAAGRSEPKRRRISSRPTAMQS